MNNINICLACDDNYSRYAAVVITSALVNQTNDSRLSFYILDGGIEKENIDKILTLKNIKDCDITFVKVDEKEFEIYKNLQTHQYITLPTYYRLKLASILPFVNRIIYMDCDVIVNSSLDELFNTDLENNIIAGVLDIRVKNKNHWKNEKYINAGMVLFDLEKFRKENIEDIFYEYTKNHLDEIKTGDQDIINFALKDRIKIVPDTWNVQSSNFTNRSSYTNKPKIIHFVAKNKPWHFGSFSYHRNLYFKYLQLTPWSLKEEELDYWYKKNQAASLIKYLQYRPLFMFRPKFYQALFYTYIKPLFAKNV